MSDQLSKWWPLYSQVPLSTQRIRSRKIDVRVMIYLWLDSIECVVSKKVQEKACEIKKISHRLPGQHFGTMARNVAGSGAHSKQCGSTSSKANVDGHSIFSQCTPLAIQIHSCSQPSLNCMPVKYYDFDRNYEVRIGWV